MPIFSGSYDHLTQPELAKVISENAFVCMYLAFQLTQLVEMSVQFSKLLGVSFRVNEMISELNNRYVHFVILLQFLSQFQKSYFTTQIRFSRN